MKRLNIFLCEFFAIFTDRSILNWRKFKSNRIKSTKIKSKNLDLSDKKNQIEIESSWIVSRRRITVSFFYYCFILFLFFSVCSSIRHCIEDVRLYYSTKNRRDLKKTRWLKRMNTDCWCYDSKKKYSKICKSCSNREISRSNRKIDF